MPLDLSTSTKFITNFDDDTSTSGAVKDLAAKSTKLDFLVGYFFFSGFTELCKAKTIGVETPLRILVGMDVDVDIRDIVEKAPIRDYSDKPERPSKADIRAQFEKIQIKSFNTEKFDTPEKKDAALFFAEKLKNGTLEVRKTKEPNHAKMYLFAFPFSGASKPADDKGRVLIGSSNISYQGLIGRNEINVLLKDNHDFDDASKIFDHLWKEAVPIADKETDINKLLQQTWVEAKPTPYLMYIRTLHEYFSVDTGEFRTPRQCTRDESVLDVRYQIDAVQEGIYKIRKHSGCIIADVVGLGKTIVAATIAKNLDLKTIVICPPHMKEQWEYEMEQRFKVNATVFGSGIGSIEEAVKRFSKRRGELLVIVDEAHRYRNENSQTYGFLHRLCFGNKVVLLSATPFNNRPGDIFSLIKLFQVPSHSTIQTVNNLGDKMTELKGRYNDLQSKNRDEKEDISNKKAKLANELRDVLDPVMIRRTRTDLKNVKKYREDLEAQHVDFSELGDPKPLDYELKPKGLSDLYMSTLEKIKPADGAFENGKFKATRYRPLSYLKEEHVGTYSEIFSVANFSGQTNMATFMQRLLVRRFESCSESFRISLNNLLTSCKTIQKWYKEKEVVPICKKGRRLPEILDDDDTIDIYDEVEKNLRDPDIIFVKKHELNWKKFEDDLADDIKVLGGLMEEWGKTTEGFKVDPKLDVIIDELEKSLGREPKRKLIIFTEFKDTAEHLYGKLDQLAKRNPAKTRIKPFIYTGESSDKDREIVRRNFDASLPKNNRDNDFNVLIATDSISEGYNLHRAGTIYNYDIPYNPTRIIQRVGRIDRMNEKMFDELFIYNFFPTPIGEEYSRTGEIAKFKMSICRALLGADAKFLSPDEDNPEGYLNQRIVEEYNESRGEDSWKSEFLNDLHRVENEEGKLLEKAKKIPPRTRISRPDAPSETPQGVYVFAKKGEDCRFAFAPSDGSEPEVLSPELALKIFRAHKDEKHNDVSGEFYALYKKACESTGKTKLSAKISKQEQEADRKLKYVLGLLEKQSGKETGEFKYLEKLSKVIKNKGLTAYHLRFIIGEKLDKLEDVASFRKNIPEGYLDGILEKISTIDSAPESVVLSEEFQNHLLI